MIGIIVLMVNRVDIIKAEYIKDGKRYRGYVGLKSDNPDWEVQLCEEI